VVYCPGRGGPPRPVAGGGAPPAAGTQVAVADK
jgi:hypothetical protein